MMPMTCAEIQPMVGWLLDNELDQAHSAEVEAHLESCARCRHMLQESGQLRHVLRRAAASTDTPVALRRRIRQSMAHERRSQVGLTRAWPAAVAAAILVSFVWHNTPSGGPPRLAVLGRQEGGAQPMDVTSTDVAAVAHYLSDKLDATVELPHVEAPESAPGPVTVAARIVAPQRTGELGTAYVRYALPHGGLTLMVRAQATLQLAGPMAAASAALGPMGMPHGDGSDAAPVALGRDALGRAVAQWQTGGLVYAMVSELPPQEFAHILAHMTR